MSIHPAFIEKETPFITRFGLWMAIWAHILSGVVTLFMVFPFTNLKTRHFHIQQWSIKLLKIFGIQLRVLNPGILPSNSYLLASNHISWLDIHAINAFKPIRFVAKSEVEKWPIFGWMAKQLGTVFIKRDSSRHAHMVVGEMSVVLKSESVCIFPEGTSTIGETVRPFKPNLFEAAVLAEVPVCTLAIAYFDRETGQHSEVPAFVGDMGLIGSMASILKNRRLRVELTFFPAINTDPGMHIDRKALALHSQEQIAQYLIKYCN